MKYVLGIDGGGTSTNIEIRNLEDELIARESFGSLNLNGEDLEIVKNTINNIFKYIDDNNYKNIEYICLGTAGLSNPEAKKLLENSIRENYTGKYSLVGDHEIGLFGAFGKSEGIILISGTGSICLGIKGDKFKRAGGYGHLIDDEGSGYAIARDILSSIVRSYDGRNKPTVYKDLVFNKLKINTIEELIKFVYDKNRSKSEIAEMAVFLDMGIENNEKAGKDILDKAVNELFLLVKTVIEELNLEKGEIAYQGSVLLKNENINNGLSSKIKSNYPDIKIIEPRYSSATGACKMAINILNRGD